MSKYTSILREFDTKAKENFEAFKKVEKAYNKAQENARLYKKGSGYNAETKAKEFRAQAELEEARAAYQNATSAFQGDRKFITDLRGKMESALDEDYRVRPDKVDLVTLELMKSGIMKSNDFRHLLNEAKASENHTMMRLIARYAMDAADAIGDNMHPEAVALRGVSIEGNSDNGNEYRKAFEAMESIYNRCTVNPGLIDHWGEFVHVDE